jgi:hypothetical protein
MPNGLRRAPLRVCEHLLDGSFPKLELLLERNGATSAIHEMSLLPVALRQKIDEKCRPPRKPLHFKEHRARCTERMSITRPVMLQHPVGRISDHGMGANAAIDRIQKAADGYIVPSMMVERLEGAFMHLHGKVYVIWCLSAIIMIEFRAFN